MNTPIPKNSTIQMISVQNLEISKGKIVAPSTVDRICIRYMPVIDTKNSMKKFTLDA